MHRDGAIVLRKTLLQLVKILFDSGEIHASYIDPKLVARYRTMFEPFIRPIQRSVTLGDARTTHSVFGMGSHIIIGLLDIARTFGTLFIKMIQKAMDNEIFVWLRGQELLFRPSTSRLCLFAALEIYDGLGLGYCCRRTERRTTELGFWTRRIQIV